MTKQLEAMKEQLRSKDREIGSMEDELDAKNLEITQNGKYILVRTANTLWSEQ